jgi:hypothetical protein
MQFCKIFSYWRDFYIPYCNESWNCYHPEEVWNVTCQHSQYMG